MLLTNDHFGKMKFERSTDMCPLKKEIVSYLFDFVIRKQRDVWWQYKGEFKYEDETYNLECECKTDGIVFSYRNLHIEHKQVVIDIDDMIKAGVLQ